MEKIGNGKVLVAELHSTSNLSCLKCCRTQHAGISNRKKAEKIGGRRRKRPRFGCIKTQKLMPFHRPWLAAHDDMCKDYGPHA
uniref:Uncharacterized protein n=1 Tax=Oryza sativa subsp. japonica TaxID=39947 RepID=Q8H3L7_ORYSJ|nr:hypothetical protein [Oryza sativa Japonica Group]